MGYGTATAEIPIGLSIASETAHITIIRAPAADGQIGLLFNVFALTPVWAELVFPGLLLPAQPPFGGHIKINVPIISALAGGPNVAVVQLRSVIAPKNLIYYERIRDRIIRYHPRRIMLPATCPHGGFQFAASFTFEDGDRATTRTNIPCPHT